MARTPLDSLLEKIDQRDRARASEENRAKFDMDEYLRSRGVTTSSYHRPSGSRLAATVPPTEEREPNTRYSKVYWEILPPGEYPFERIKSHFGRLHKSGIGKQIELERLKAIEQLGPEEVYIGKTDFEGYIVFNFKQKRLAVLDCPYFGNAIYIVKGDWRKISRMSKSEVLENYTDCKRIFHRGDWKERLSSLLDRSPM